MAELSDVVLGHVAKNGILNSLEFAQLVNEDHQKVVGVIKSLQAIGNVIRTEQKSVKQWELTEEGKEVVEKGSHEAIVFNAVPKDGVLQTELMKLVPNAKIGFAKAMSSGWIHIEKLATGGFRVLRKMESIEDVVQQNLIKLSSAEVNNVPDSMKQEYKKRKLLQEVIIKSIDVSKGAEFSTTICKPETDLTPEMLASGSWKDKTFKPYNFDAMGVRPTCGHLHPLMRTRAQFRQIFLEMGFTEMPTNNFIESSFWNFDALFVPQKHPARDMHDTFFVAEPKNAETFPMDYLERVRKVHQDGAYGSQGYKCEWKIEEAKKNVLRTHTTSVSARMLYQLAQQKGFTPVKYFSIDRVFRNETLDATHLAEFFQVEGVIADYGLSLGDLIGVLHEFFKKLGITKLRFKPAYNPYTEPSMEVFSYHEGLKKWVEVGNSGIFRPEMLLPMGLDKGVTVIAWGLSLERPTMIKFGIDNIRDLEGHKVNLQMVYDAPICRLDKSESGDDDSLQQLEIKQGNILNRLQTVKKALQTLTERLKLDDVLNSAKSARTTGTFQSQNDICPADVFVHKDIVIHLSTRLVPYSAFVLCKLLGRQRNLTIFSHFHSSLSNVPEHLQRVLNGSNSVEFSPEGGACSAALKVTLVWHDGVTVPHMMVSPVHQWRVEGEVNIARYLARHLDPPYDADALVATRIDTWLDSMDGFVLGGSTKDLNSFVALLQAALGASPYLIGGLLTLADVVVWSFLQQKKAGRVRLPLHVQSWVDKLSQMEEFNLVSQVIKADGCSVKL